MKLKDKIEFNLASPIEYHDDQGGHANGQLLVLSAPSMNNDTERLKLSQAFFQAVTDGERPDQEDSKDSDMEIPGAAVLAILFGAKSDVKVVVDTFKTLLLAPGICMVENKVPMTEVLYNSMDPEDRDDLMGEYIANFILSSRLKKLATISNPPSHA